METKSFKQLISKRKQWIKSSKENKFDFDSILSGIYNDPSHFIYEILQNAEDALATEVSFNLSNTSLEIRHNGREFNFNDVDGITGIGISTKKDDINAIGKFGVGFKSVFAITKTPIIHSGIYHFKIEEFVVPSNINHDNVECTLIVLPFNHPKRTQKEVFDIIRKKLESLDLKTLLFLKKIKQIIWEAPDSFGHYFKKSNKIKQISNVYKTSITSETNNNKTEEKFLVIDKPIKIESQNLKVEIAYRISSDRKRKNYITKEKDSKLIVFFPTEKVTFLNFLIQGPYKTTPNRENIPLDDPQNQFLISETAELIADSIKVIKEIGFLNSSFLEVLPIDQNHTEEIIYSSFFDKVKEKLLSDEPLLPTSKQSFTTSQNGIMARGKELTDILDESDLDILFNKNSWLDPNITYDKTRQLHDYLTDELEVKEVDFENFAVSINKEFIKAKSDAWLVGFYGSLLNQRSLWEESRHYFRNEGILRKKPIIRLSNNQHIEPCDSNDKIQVYLPVETKSKYKTVKRILTENQQSLKFLTELGLSRPDILAEIKEFIIPKYNKSELKIGDEEYYEDVEKLLLALSKEESDKKKEIFSELKKLPIIFCQESISDKQFLVIPEEAYFPNPELTEYFRDYDKVYFVSNEFDEKLPDKKDSLKDLFLELGCENKPRKMLVDSVLTNEEKKLLRKNNYQSNISFEIHTYDYDYEGLDNFFRSITKERSIILWNFLISSLATFDRRNKQNFFLGEYCWNYYTQHAQKFDSKFLKTLKNTKWLFDVSENIFSAHEITLSMLPDWYNKNDENIEILIDALDFQLDELRRLEEKTGKKVILLDPIEEQEFNRWKKEKYGTKDEDENSEDKWIPEVAPEGAEIAIEVIEPEIIEISDLRGQRPNQNITAEDSDEDENDSESETERKIPKHHLDDIGNWGERYVYRHLKEEYEDAIQVEIIWLNEDGNVGQGYDFSIVGDGKEIEYIEVKSKVDDSPQFIEITGKQWEFARKLYNEKEGDKYKIYVVSDAGTDKAKIGIICNPVKLWKEGKLYAHPVNIKL